MKSEELIPVHGEDKVFYFRIPLHPDLVLAFYNYLYLFRRFCSVIKGREVFYAVHTNHEAVLIELGFTEECNLEQSSLYLKEYLSFISDKSLLINLEESVEGDDIADKLEFEVLKRRLLEQRKHLLTVFRLELGLRNIVEFSGSSFFEATDFHEIDAAQNKYEIEISNYQALIELVKLEEKNKYLDTENTYLKEQLRKIEREKDIMINQITAIINERLITANSIAKGKIDKRRLKELVEKNQLKEVFSLLKLTDDADLKVRVIVLSNQWHDLEKRKSLGMTSIEERTKESTRILLAVLKIIDELSDEK